MEMSIREAKARFSEAIAAVERGESVLVTKHGRPVAELRKPEPRKGGVDWEAGEAYLKSVGWNAEGVDLWPPEFDDPAFSRKVLGLDD
jgi:antitoxin (DNA-binding transcriptional repressor) of toxin-antitoxin stability system